MGIQLNLDIKTLEQAGISVAICQNTVQCYL